MKHAAATLALVFAAALPASSYAGGTIVASASAMRLLAPYVGMIEAKSEQSVAASPLGTGQIVLDVLDGKASAAAVTVPLPQAIAAAREAAWEEGRMLVIPDSLQFHPVSSLSQGTQVVGFVTLGNSDPALRATLASLR
ncbi:MAG: hypothetical protein ACXWG1_12030 [Usitatibacter sp.]